MNSCGCEPPHDGTVRCNQDVCRNGYVLSINTPALVNETVITNHLAIRITQDGEGQIIVLHNLACPLRRIDRNGQQTTTHRFQRLIDDSEPAEF